MAGLGALATNMHLPALSSMADWFGASYATMQLSVSAFLGATAVVQLIIGPLSDRYGRRPVYLTSLIILIVASLACAAVSQIEFFLFFRVIQTIATGGMVLSRAVVRDMVPMEKAASMIGYVTMGMTLIPMVGPVAGGYLGSEFGWQAIFISQAAMGLVVLILSYFDLGETNANPSSSFSRQFRDWPELFGSRRFWGYTFTATFTTSGYYVFLGGAPYVGSTTLGLEDALLGYALAVPAIGYIVGNFLSGRFAATAGVNVMMTSGAVSATLGILTSLLLFAFGYHTAVSFFGPLTLIGFGNGLTLPSANAGMVSVRPHLAGSASGLGGAVTIGGAALLAAITGALLTPERGALLLLGIMLLTGILSLASTLYVWSIDRREGALAR
ncbi:multidrug effflux MFS transporter [Rhizobium sp. L1K21]|nr:multidrug effflux MFS transporter [Rhizobium sp. L1K21]